MSGRLIVVGLALGCLVACAKNTRDSGQHGAWLRTFPPGSGRPLANACPPRPASTPEPGRAGTCKSDAECTAGSEGRCTPQNLGAHSHMAPPNACSYNSCTSDADCKTGGPCECDGYRGNYCVAGNCKTDADCGKGGSCGRSNSVGCESGDPGYFCRTAQDTCVNYDDCSPPKHPGRGGQCVFQAKLGHWACQDYPECPVG